MPALKIQRNEIKIRARFINFFRVIILAQIKEFLFQFRKYFSKSYYPINPYKFGLVGASDTHTGAISDKESDFHSKIGILDGTPELRGAAPLTKSFKEQIEGSGANVIINGYKEIGGQEYIDTG